MTFQKIYKHADAKQSLKTTQPYDGVMMLGHYGAMMMLGTLWWCWEHYDDVGIIMMILGILWWCWDHYDDVGNIMMMLGSLWWWRFWDHHDDEDVRTIMMMKMLRSLWWWRCWDHYDDEDFGTIMMMKMLGPLWSCGDCSDHYDCKPDYYLQRLCTLQLMNIANNHCSSSGD